MWSPPPLRGSPNESVVQTTPDSLNALYKWDPSPILAFSPPTQVVRFLPGRDQLLVGLGRDQPRGGVKRSEKAILMVFAGLVMPEIKNFPDVSLFLPVGKLGIFPRPALPACFLCAFPGMPAPKHFDNGTLGEFPPFHFCGEMRQLVC